MTLRSASLFSVLSLPLLLWMVGPVMSAALVKSQPQTPFLKEILLGRCYENSNNNLATIDAALCPVVVDSFLGVIEGRLEETIQPESFFMYMGWTSTSNEKFETDTALLVWPPLPAAMQLSDRNDNNNHYVLPETTPSGAMMKGLVFCGVDQRLHCPVEYWDNDINEKGALAAFWKAVYSDFGTKVQGRMTMVLLEKDLAAVPSLWNATLENLDPEAVTKIDIMAANCNALGVAELIQNLEDIHLDCGCTQLAETRDDNGDSSSCGIEDLLRVQASTETNGHATSVTNPPFVDCQCSENLYQYLFWAIVVLGLAGGYAMWSVWHYLPDYQRIPNVEHELMENGGDQTVLPKQ